MLHLLSPILLQLDWPEWRESQEQGEQCIYCGKDSWTCEHFDPREEALNNQ